MDNEKYRSLRTDARRKIFLYHQTQVSLQGTGSEPLGPVPLSKIGTQLLAPLGSKRKNRNSLACLGNADSHSAESYCMHSRMRTTGTEPRGWAAPDLLPSIQPCSQPSTPCYSTSCALVFVARYTLSKRTKVKTKGAPGILYRKGLKGRYCRSSGPLEMGSSLGWIVVRTWCAALLFLTACYLWRLISLRQKAGACLQ